MIKSKIFIFILLFLPAVCFAQGWDGEVWMGQYSNQTFPANPDFDSQAAYTSGMELGYTHAFNKNLSIRPYTGIEVFMDSRRGINFHPAGIEFYTGGEIKYKNSFIQFEHMCWHPIDTGGSVYQYDLIKMGLRFNK